MPDTKAIKHLEYNMKLNILDIRNDIINIWTETNLSNGMEICVYRNIPEELISDYSRVLTHLENDMPDEPGNESVFIDENEIRNEVNIISYVIFFKNEIVGLSRFFLSDSTFNRFYQGQIGIIDQYRGKGLAKYLLGFSYKNLLNSYNELESITVDTHPSNAIMIFLLEKLGFIYTHTEIVYRD